MITWGKLVAWFRKKLTDREEQNASVYFILNGKKYEVKDGCILREGEREDDLKPVVYLLDRNFEDYDDFFFEEG